MRQFTNLKFYLPRYAAEIPTVSVLKFPFAAFSQTRT